jgi:adenylosuccinate lyase
VQRNAMRAWDEGRPLRDLLAEDDEVGAAMGTADLDALFDPAWYTRHVDELMTRVEAL